jgi:LacI family transcriptional regulator
MKAVRLIDVARASDTSIKTVSRVINGDLRVSDQTRLKVSQKISELGYQVDQIARSLRLGVDNVIGVVVQKIGDQFFAEAVEEIEQVAKERGLGVLVGSTYGDLERENNLVHGFRQRKVAGMILTAQDADYSFLKDSSIPTVFFDRAPKNLSADVVCSNDEEGGYIATMHLIKHGHKKIAIFGDDISVETSKLRLSGYKNALRKSGIEVDESLIFMGLNTIADSEKAFQKMLQGRTLPSAIFSARGEVSIGLVRAMHKLNKTDIAFISFDDFNMAEILEPAVTVLDHSAREIAKAAIHRLFTRIDGVNLENEKIVIPLNIIPRGSGEIINRGAK